MENQKVNERKNWVRLDNASNIFLAAMSNRDSKVFRISAEVTDTVDPDLLQQALNKVFEQNLLYHSVLRRGFFWYYLEESDLKPKVEPDTNTPCRPLYFFDRRNLLFRVMYWKKRVSLEVFHVLSDGTGAMWFFQDLITEYLSLKHPDLKDEDVEVSTYIHDQSSEDSFERHFRRKDQLNFSKAAQSALRGVTTVGAKAKNFLFPAVEKEPKPSRKVYHYKGTYTSDYRPRVVELEMPVKDILKKAKAMNVSLTVYLTAVFMESIRKAEPNFQGDETMAVSVPVNLRQFFPSDSARNFFAVTRLEYKYKKNGDNSLKAISQELKNQLDPQLEKDSLESWLSQLIQYEYHPLSRIILRPIKDLALKFANYMNNRKLTFAISNLGLVSFPYLVDQMIHQVYFHTIAVRPQFCAISHNDVLTITFTSPFIETDIYRHYVRFLSDENIPVTMTVNKVTEEELGGRYDA
ncbi:MAG: alcohol acetyltransferase [Ruoffia tabacinasalis]|uniref:alcohol acetyltransferase n=1 Tax=unclassified Ruoffia TaxID=2862149 RepID=UPI00388B3B6E